MQTVAAIGNMSAQICYGGRNCKRIYGCTIPKGKVSDFPQRVWQVKPGYSIATLKSTTSNGPYRLWESNVCKTLTSAESRFSYAHYRIAPNNIH